MLDSDIICRKTHNSGPSIRLSEIEIDKLKRFGKEVEYDGVFIGYFLGIIFENDILKVSSARGGVSNFNGKSNIPLDSQKLEFIEGNFHRFKKSI